MSLVGSSRQFAVFVLCVALVIGEKRRGVWLERVVNRDGHFLV
jgi:hypothetical protein